VKSTVYKALHWWFNKTVSENVKIYHRSAAKNSGK